MLCILGVIILLLFSIFIFLWVIKYNKSFTSEITTTNDTNSSTTNTFTSTTDFI